MAKNQQPVTPFFGVFFDDMPNAPGILAGRCPHHDFTTSICGQESTA